MHIQRHTHTSTHLLISTQEDSWWRQPDTGAWLRGAEERLLLKTKALHTHTKKKMSEKNRYSRIWRKEFEHIELPAKLLEYFLRSNKSNINQCIYTCIYRYKHLYIYRLANHVQIHRAFTTARRAVDIRLQIITTATGKISNKFSRSPRNFQTSFHGSPQNFGRGFIGVNGSPRHSTSPYSLDPRGSEIPYLRLWSH